MRPILLRLASEWERTALGIAGLAFGCFLLAWLLPSPPAGNTQPETMRSRRPSFLGPEACSFLEANQQAGPSGDAFAFAYIPPPEPPQDPPKIADKKPEPEDPETTGGKGSEDANGTDQIPPGDEPDEPDDTPPVPNTRLLRYLGTYESTNGQRLAALAVSDPKSGSTETQFLRAGQACGGIRVDRFDAQSLHVLVPDGTRATVDRGDVRTVTMD